MAKEFWKSMGCLYLTTGIQSAHPEGSVVSCFPEEGTTFLAIDKTAE